MIKYRVSNQNHHRKGALWVCLCVDVWADGYWRMVEECSSSAKAQCSSAAHLTLIESIGCWRLPRCPQWPVSYPLLWLGQGLGSFSLSSRLLRSAFLQAWASVTENGLWPLISSSWESADPLPFLGTFSPDPTPCVPSSPYKRLLTSACPLITLWKKNLFLFDFETLTDFWDGSFLHIAIVFLIKASPSLSNSGFVFIWQNTVTIFWGWKLSQYQKPDCSQE